jgi:hypothetical protein
MSLCCVIIINVSVLSVIRLTVIRLTVIRLTVIRLNVVAAIRHLALIYLHFHCFCSQAIIVEVSL